MCPTNYFGLFGQLGLPARSGCRPTAGCRRRSSSRCQASIPSRDCETSRSSSSKRRACSRSNPMRSALLIMKGTPYNCHLNAGRDTEAIGGIDGWRSSVGHKPPRSPAAPPASISATPRSVTVHPSRRRSREPRGANVHARSLGRFAAAVRISLLINKKLLRGDR